MSNRKRLIVGVRLHDGWTYKIDHNNVDYIATWDEGVEVVDKKGKGILFPMRSVERLLTADTETEHV